jgi:hypothetical protein
MSDTNRTLYLDIAALAKEFAPNPRTLEEYLLSALGLFEERSEEDSITPTAFIDILRRSFTYPPLTLDPSWRGVLWDNEATGFAVLRQQLRQQIVDLREMDEHGTLNDPHREFGLDAPSGIRWYNFVTSSYLECGCAGEFGGWEPDDDSDRTLVPGPVAYLEDDGSIGTANPEDLARPVVALDDLSWDQVEQFFWCGRSYE